MIDLRSRWLPVILTLVLLLSSCARAEKVSLENLVKDAPSYEGRIIRTEACLSSTRHGQSFYPCSDRTRESGLAFRLEEPARLSPSGQRLEKAGYENWAPALHDRQVRVDLSGTVELENRVYWIVVTKVYEVEIGRSAVR